MRINITFSGLDPTPSIKVFVETKFNTLTRFTKRFDSENQGEIEVELGRSTKHHKHGDVFMVNARLRLPKKTMSVNEKGSDVRVVVTEVRDKMRMLLEREKEKLVEKERGS